MGRVQISHVVPGQDERAHVGYPARGTIFRPADALAPATYFWRVGASHDAGCSAGAERAWVFRS
jgi:hypothetical protein